MHHLSTNTISPKKLENFLLEVVPKLPNNLELPRYPSNDIWYFYKTLTCITYLEDNEIRIVLKIPLMNKKKKYIYEVYKVHNLPMPLHHVSADSNNFLIEYNLETEMLMASEDRTKFSHL